MKTRVGKNNPNWKGGVKQSAGRCHVYTANGYKLRSRYNMERHLGRRLNKDEVVHHIDEDITNDDPSNLEIKTRSEHRIGHNKTRVISTETRIKMGESFRGKLHTEETKLKISNANTGLKRSQATKDKLSEIAKLRYYSLPPEKRVNSRGKPAHNKGVPMSTEQKLKLSISRKLYLKTKNEQESLCV